MLNLKTILVLCGLAGGAAVATFGAKDPEVNFSSLLDLWSDTLRDADQAGMKATRVSDAEEIRIGSDLAQSVLAGEVKSANDTAYVTAVAQRLVPHVARTGIPYHFHVVKSPQINAFALPGGQIVVFTGLLDFLESEAELAAVLGHEMSHVDLRHCIERYQYELKLKHAGVPEAGAIIEMAHGLATASFAPYQELDADAQGVRLSVEAGYDPEAAARLFHRMKAVFGETSTQPGATPAAELERATAGAFTAYFRTHPPSAARAQALDHIIYGNRRNLGDRTFYVGKENLKQRIARDQHEWR
jgi:beta-barrel assembly-enhancing protease